MCGPGTAPAAGQWLGWCQVPWVDHPRWEGQPFTRSPGAAWNMALDTAPKGHMPVPTSCPPTCTAPSHWLAGLPFTCQHGTLTNHLWEENTWFLKTKWTKKHVLFKLIFKK